MPAVDLKELLLTLTEVQNHGKIVKIFTGNQWKPPFFRFKESFCSLVSYVSCENRSFPADFLLNRSSEKMVKSEESIKKIAICPVSIFCYAGAWP